MISDLTDQEIVIEFCKRIGLSSQDNYAKAEASPDSFYADDGDGYSVVLISYGSLCARQSQVEYHFNGDGSLSGKSIYP